MSFRLLYLIVFFFLKFHGIYASYLCSTNDKLTPIKYTLPNDIQISFPSVFLYVGFLLSASFVFPKKDGLANCALYFAWKMPNALTKKGTFRNPLFLLTLLLRSSLWSLLFALFYFRDDYQETENPFEIFGCHKKTYQENYYKGAYNCL